MSGIVRQRRLRYQSQTQVITCTSDLLPILGSTTYLAACQMYAAEGSTYVLWLAETRYNMLTDHKAKHSEHEQDERKNLFWFFLCAH